ncbi:hypothetical protein Zmor_002392 [Zophobas morio]|uniref:Odorant receptor n=1 Tax=Zophobas morio TaxID=2755281 RepID=A0AA38J4T7_9CUCU|nr:hypothetical protein Zmor_002392 [Zophobas morio]
MQRIGDLSFSLNIRLLKIIGVYPSDNYKTVHKIYGYVLYIVAIVPVAVCGLLHFTCTADLTKFKNNDFVMIGIIFYPIKFFPCLIHRNKIKHCIHYYDHFDYNFLTHDHQKIIEECISTCRRNSKIFVIGCAAAVTGFIGQTLMNLEQLSLDIWLPKFVLEKPVYFYCAQFLIVTSTIYSGFFCGSIDPLMGELCYHATTQIRIVKEILQHFDQQRSVLKNLEAKSRGIFMEIKKCVRHHQTIQNFVQEFQDCFSMVIFTQFVASSFVMAFVCFQLSRMKVGLNFLTAANDLMVVSFQVFFYCYHGTLLIEESKSLSDAIYMSRWYEYDIQSKKALILLMERSKKPMVVTAGRLLQVSLETFTMILKRTYSFLAILENYS